MDYICSSISDRISDLYSRINKDMTNVYNKVGMDMEQIISSSEKPRIEWNILKRIFLAPDRLASFHRHVKKYRKIPVEIYITPLKEPEPDLKSLKSMTSNKFAKRQDRESKTRSSVSSTKGKSATTFVQNDDVPTDYLHLMALIDVSHLLYPGMATCRVACPLRVYHEFEIMELAGQSDSYFRPRPPPLSPIVEEMVPPSLKQKKSKAKKGKKEKKGSKSSKSSDKRKKDADDYAGIDLAQYLPPPPPPKPEPSKVVYANNFLPSFIIVEFELTKPLQPQRKLEDLSKTLNNIIPKKPILSNRLVSTRVVEELYNETIRSIACNINTQYQRFLADKKNCDEGNLQTFMTSLENSNMYPMYLNTLMRSITLLIREKYPSEFTASKTVEEYQKFITEMYTDLIQRMNCVLNETIKFDKNKNPPNSGPNSDALLFYAKEVMELGAPKIAEGYYLQRIASDEENANYWFDYAVFQMGLANDDKAFECIKEALQIDPLHRYSLLMYALLLTNDKKLAEAETCFLTLSIAHPRWVEGWMALHIFYMETRNEEGADVTIEMANKYKDDPGAMQDYFSETDDLAWTIRHCQENLYLRIAACLIKMRLFHFAEICLPCATRKHEGICQYLLGVICYYKQDYVHALEHLFEAKDLFGVDYGICSLIGHCLLKSARSKDALSYYTHVMKMYDRPENIHMVYLYGAICLDDSGDSQSARKLVLLLCKQSPSPQTWLHAGGYYFKQNDLISAEECLAQANLCDNRLPDVWGLLALINAYLGREHVCDVCYTQAKKFHLKDERLMDNIEKARAEMYTVLGKEDE